MKLEKKEVFMKKLIENYKALAAELNDNLTEGVLTQKDEIQILRGEKPVFQEYCAIEDWYFDAFVMEEEIGTPLEEMYLKEEFSEEEWKEMKKEQAEYKEQYEKDQPKLITMTVKDVLTELKQMQKLFA